MSTAYSLQYNEDVKKLSAVPRVLMEAMETACRAIFAIGVSHVRLKSYFHSETGYNHWASGPYYFTLRFKRSEPAEEIEEIIITASADGSIYVPVLDLGMTLSLIDKTRLLAALVEFYNHVDVSKRNPIDTFTIKGIQI